MKHSTLQHLLQTRRDPAEPLEVLVVHDGLRARKRVEQVLRRISGHLAGGLRMACAYQRLDELRHRDGRTKAPRLELVFLAVSCSATLPHETLVGVTSLLPSLKANHGALAFLSGTDVPRQLDVVLVEQFLRAHAQRAGVAFFSGYMPGLGCPGCGTPKREQPGRSGAKRLCVLHAFRNGRTSIHPSFCGESKPTKTKTPPARPVKASHQAHTLAKRQVRRERPEQIAR